MRQKPRAIFGVCCEQIEDKTRNQLHQSFNAFGESLKKILYTSSGNDLNKISSFIKNVVLEGNDEMKPLREDFFNRELNYNS